MLAGADVTGAAAELELSDELGFVAGADLVLVAGVPGGVREEVCEAMHLVQIVDVLVL